MLNPFPIQFLALLAYLILRLGLGSMLVYFGVTHMRNRQELSKVIRIVWPLALIEIVLGGMFVIGFFTQYAALAALVFAGVMLRYTIRNRSALFPSSAFYVLLMFVSLSLFITGAGALAIDLPI